MYWLKHTVYPFDKDKLKSGSQLFVGNGQEVSLQQAARDGIHSAVALCLGRDPGSVNRTDKRGMAALHYAARNGHQGIVAVLLDHGADVECQNSEKETAVHLAAKCGKVDCLVLLLSRGGRAETLDARGKSAMHLAARRGRAESLEALIRHGVEVDCRDGQLMTPLHDAVLSGSERACALLISQGANVFLKDISLRTPLMMASAEGFIGIMQNILTKASSSSNEELVNYVNAQDDEGATAMHAAVQNGFLSAIQCLRKFGANIEIKKLTGETSMHLAAINNNIDILSYLIDNEANKEGRDNQGRTPLHRATLLDRLECVTHLLAKGANIESVDAARVTPLLYAAWKGHTETLQYLLDLGANVTAVDSSLNSALHLAVMARSSESVRRLIAATKTPDEKIRLVNSRDVRDQTAAHICARVGDAPSLALLIAAGANMAAKDDEEKAALHVAAENGQSECVQILVKASLSELNDADHDGRTPLMLAVANGHKKAVQLLLAEGGNVATRDHRDDNKQTALSIACASGFKDIVQLLLDSNVDMAATDNRRDTALHVACAKNHADIVMLLLNNKADVSARNFEDQTPFNVAIDRGSVAAAQAIAEHDLWTVAMDATDKDGFTPMKQLIEKMPSVAKIIMDKCVVCQFHEDHVDRKVSYVYKYIDPHPDNECCLKQKQWFVTTMLENDRQDLVWHPLTQANIQCKWKKFGKIRFAISFVTFIMFLIMLTAYTLMTPSIGAHTLDSDNCPIMMSNETESEGQGGSADPPPPDDSMMGSNNTNPMDGGAASPGAGSGGSNTDGGAGNAPNAAGPSSGSIQGPSAATSATPSAVVAPGGPAPAAAGTPTSSVTVASHETTATAAAPAGVSAAALTVAAGAPAAPAAISTTVAAPAGVSAGAVTVAAGAPAAPAAISTTAEAAAVGPVTTAAAAAAAVGPATTAAAAAAAVGPATTAAVAAVGPATTAAAAAVGPATTAAAAAVGPATTGTTAAAAVLVATSAPSAAAPVAATTASGAVVGPPASGPTASLPILAPAVNAPTSIISNSSAASGNSTSKGVISASNSTSNSSSNSSASNTGSSTRERTFKKTRGSAMLSSDMQSGVIFIQISVTVIMLIFALQQVLMALYLRHRFFRRISSYASLVLIATSGVFCWPGSSPCLTEWRCGWVANFSGWLFLFEYLMSFKMTGVLTMMLQTVSISLAKVLVLLILFLFAFGSVFHILLETYDGFGSYYMSSATVLSMAVGEINFSDRFVTESNTFYIDALVMALIFIFCVPILFMNLTIGIAVDDIDGIRKTAALKQLESQVFYIYDFEVTAAKTLQRRWYMPSTSIMPNQKKSILSKKLLSLNETKANRTSAEEASPSLNDLCDQVSSIQKTLAQIETQLQQIVGTGDRSAI